MNWRMYDDARGIPTGVEPRLMPNLTNAEETTYDKLDITSTGFVLNLDNNDMNQKWCITHIYRYKNTRLEIWTSLIICATIVKTFIFYEFDDCPPLSWRDCN